MLGVIGFGNLVSYEASDGKFKATIENASLPLLIVGTVVGALDSITGSKPEAEWSVTPDGDLELTLTSA